MEQTLRRGLILLKARAAKLGEIFQITETPQIEPRPSNQHFDAAAIKRQFPSLANSGLHYLDNAATAQMPEIVLDAMRRFELEARECA